MSRLTGSVPAFADCPNCIAYVERRGSVIEPAITQHARKARLHRNRLAHLFFIGVHDRHMAGKAI